MLCGSSFLSPLALFAQECYTLAIKDSALSAGFSEIRKNAYANRTDRIFAHTGYCVPHGGAAGGVVRGPVAAACQPRQRHGGAPNTCKSNERERACFLERVANG